MTPSNKILLARTGGASVLKFEGDVRLSLAPTLSRFVNSIGQMPDLETIIIDLTSVDCIDSTILGLLAKISLRSQEALNVLPTIVSTNDDVTRVLMSMGFDGIFVIAGEGETPMGGGELPPEIVSEEEMRDQVIDAHRVLMSLSDSNEKTFRDLVDSLEGERLLSQPRVRAVR